MDQFEQARLRNEKRLERMARTQANQAEEKVVFIEPPKQKAETQDAVIEVKVTMPDRVIAFTLVKGNVYQESVPAKLTKNGIINCVTDGLRPLLGGVKVL